MTPEPAEAAANLAADYANAARRLLPGPTEVAPRPGAAPDPQSAAAYAALAAYFQMYAITAILNESPAVAEVIRRNTGMLDHVGTGVFHLSRGLDEVRAAVERLDRTVDRGMDTPSRRAFESVEAWWDRFKRRRMPIPPLRPPAGVPPSEIADSEPPPSMSQVDLYDSREFEEYVAALFREAGWDDVEVVGAHAGTPVGRGDGAVDVVAKSGETTVAIQCKRYKVTSAVNVSDVRNFFAGATADYTPAAMVLVTTTQSLTPAARDFIEKTGTILIDRPLLTEWVEQGVVPEAVAVLHPAAPAAPESAEAGQVDEPVPPAAPKPPFKVMGFVGFAVVALMIAPIFLRSNPKVIEFALYAVIAVLLVCLGVAFRWRWRLYWWRRGINELWWGWHVPRGHTRAFRVPNPWKGPWG
ncbi:restriction endonuclease [Dactylosporangium sp. CA-139114]|uniref:restriction endonuclease n=1 Tax=Dactylosporangium sp. CA-139114 TaxID=3239931 RepID=UPI003D9672AF